MNAIDVIGHKYGRLTVLKFSHSNRNEKRMFECVCECGRSVTVVLGSLRNGNTTSCGCFRDEEIRKPENHHSTHRLSDNPIYASWNGMINRCYNKNIPRYALYGARGIKVCEFIRASPHNLHSIVGDRPRGMSMDRKNNNGNYSCGQCAECLEKGWPMNLRWATQKEQCNNKRTNRLITVGCATKTLAQWSDLSGLKASIIHKRISSGWTPERAISP
jgi:hypothetical protein